MKVTRTWDSCLSMLPKGGTTIWGDASWSPEEGYDCSVKKSDESSGGAVKGQTESGLDVGAHGKPFAHYGRMVAFGKEAAAVSYDVILNRKKEVKVPFFTVH
jgi:phospholipid:diacylglycerol acyltransferase